MMDFKKIVSDLERSPQWKVWRKSDKDAFLAHIFVMNDEANQDACQVGYYDEKKARMVTFVISMEGGIQTIPDQEVLQDPQTPILPLDISKVDHIDTAVWKKCDEFRVLEYPKSFPLKSFFIVQNTHLGQVYNVSYLTMAYTALNIKLSTVDLAVITHSEQQLMRFDKGEDDLKAAAAKKKAQAKKDV